jgi:FRG domain
MRLGDNADCQGKNRMSDQEEPIPEGPYHLRLPLWPDFKLLDNDIDGRIPTCRIEGWEHFEKSLIHNAHDASESEMIYRGQRGHDWPLASTLTRQFDGGAIPTDISGKLHKRFLLAMRGRGVDLISYEENEVWAFGQHFGLATPLLDWTESPFVALFFAFAEEDPSAEEDKNTSRAVFCLNRSLIQDLLEDLFFEPSSSENSRLVNQAGLFTVTPSGDDNLTTAIINAVIESGAIDPDDPNDLARYLCKIHIPNEGRLACLRMLRKMNIHHANLFPDSSGASQYCNDWLSRAVLESKQAQATADKIQKSSSKPMPPEEHPEPQFDPAGDLETVLSGLLIAEDGIAPIQLADWVNRIGIKYTETAVLDWPVHQSSISNMRVELKRLLAALGFPKDRRNQAVENLVSHFSLHYTSAQANEKIEGQQ